jgi:hypothetical protein
MRAEDLMLVLWIIFTGLALRWHARRMAGREPEGEKT